MSPSPGIPMHPSILLIIALIYMNHESVVALEPVLQRTIIEEAQSLNLTKVAFIEFRKITKDNLFYLTSIW